jgi:tetratricopeptide (TPR) repeat protein
MNGAVHSSGRSLLCFLCFALPFGSLAESSVPDWQAHIDGVVEMRHEGAYADGLALARSLADEARTSGDERLYAEAVYQSALLHYFMNDYAKARTLAEIALVHARTHAFRDLETDLLNAWGVIEWKSGNLWQATQHLDKALAMQRAVDDTVGMANTSNNLGIIQFALKEYQRAVEYYEQGLKWAQDDDNQRLTSSLLSNLGESLLQLGRLEEAEAYLLQSLEIEEALQDPYYLAYSFFNFGELRSAQKAYAEAQAYYDKALKIQLELDERWGSALTHLRIAESYLQRALYPQAREALFAGYETVKSLSAWPLLRDYSLAFTELYEGTGDDGLRQYYADLSIWFEQQAAEVDNPVLSEVAMEAIAGPTGAQSDPERASYSPLRLLVLLLLAAVLGLLLLENARLRKTARQTAVLNG